MQTLNTNVYDASRNSRSFGGNIVGVVNNVSVNGTLDRNETFYGTSSSATSGSWPRVTLSRNERPLFGSVAYFSLVGDYSSLVRENRVDAVTTDLSLTRLEVMPQIRYPFTKWQWFTANSTVSWRDTYFSRSLAPGTSDVIDQGLNRRFFEFQTRLMGPVIARVWNTPDNGYAEKFKHSVEPFLTIGRTTSIDEFDRIIQIDAGDSIVGGATRYTYGVTNRFFAKQRRPGTTTGQAREIASVDVTQSYYSDERSAQYDQTYSTSFLGAPPSHYSPISVNARSAPTDLFSVTLRAEIDSQYLALAHDFRQRLLLRPPGDGDRRVEQARLHRRTRHLQRSDQARSVHQRVGQRAHAGQRGRSDLHHQLRRAPLASSPAAHHRLLQLAVLRAGIRVPGVQPQRPGHRYQRAVPGSPLLHVVHACRPGQLLAVQRRVVRRSPLSRQRRMPGSILITGAAGFAGSHLVDLLANDGADIVAWHRPGGSPTFPAPGTTWQAVDLLDRDRVRQGIAAVRPAAVYHCAGAPHIGKSWNASEPTFATNVRATHYLLSALHDAGVDARVMLPSSAMVYQPADEPLSENSPLRPPNPYGLSKLAMELLGQRTASNRLVVTIGRPFNHIGPRQDPVFAASGFAKQIAEIESGGRGNELVVGNLDARREVTDVRDTVRAYQAILERGQSARVYNVSSGHAVAIGDILEMLCARASVPIRVRVDPSRFRPNDVPLLVGDSTRLRDELGWTPTIPLARTLDDLLDFWRGFLRQTGMPWLEPLTPGGWGPIIGE